jgi:cold shock CspA family protein
MRTHGTLTKWNDDRGFGFITPAKGPPDIFVHISEFPREGGRPTVNELISFEVVPGPDGKQRAVRVMRPGQKAARPLATRTRQQPQSRWLSRALTLLILAALGAYGYSRYTQRVAEAESAMVEEAVHLASPPDPVPPEAAQPSPSDDRDIPAAAPLPAVPASPYSCDGRTMCSQMRSCAEATYFIRHCPNTQMDGDNDGRPCESQWCN